MRVTLDLDSFDKLSQVAYASLWLDTELHRWSRESHEFLDLPEWGILESASGETLLYGKSETNPIVLLEKLELYPTARSEQAGNDDRANRPQQGASGQALIYRGDVERKPSIGRWRILCIDHETTKAEHGVFADDVDQSTDI